MQQTYQVYHSTDWHAMLTPHGRCWHCHRDDYYVLVAEVEATSLEEVFRLTNHIDGNWQENPGVRVMGDGPVRSTSVGDVLAHGERAWVVQSFGFQEMVCSCQSTGEGEATR